MELSLSNINKTYKKGQKKALDDFSLTLENGIYGLLGPNGSGKSTLMNIITGIIKKDSGEMHFTQDGNKMDYSKFIGFLPQNQDYYKNFTGLEFISYMMDLKQCQPKNPKEYALNILSRVNLANESNKKIGAYSGGMKQRLGIAQTLIGEPKILIYDEPTAGLDPKERVRFRNVLAQFAFDKIVILSTHIVSDISVISKEVILLSKGKIIGKGTEKELCEKMNGKVWLLDCAYSTAMACLVEHRVSSISQHKESYHVRIISEDKPHETAVLTNPILEDLYLYEFGEEGA